MVQKQRAALADPSLRSGQAAEGGCPRMDLAESHSTGQRRSVVFGEARFGKLQFQLSEHLDEARIAPACSPMWRVMASNMR